ncbi:MAG: hypothetical protein A2V65_02905 [Deltaproteobacteria bacterium RBG_13_49_15]|nr:MAG: hypothetical protein A2V65_02905 [Deltaproteobacteria bacterium RBG_13_49_15]
MSMGIAMYVLAISNSVLAIQQEEVGIVLVNRLHLRKEPDIRSSSIAVLNQGENVIVLDRENGWLKVAVKDQKGYIRNTKKYIRLIQEQRPVQDGEPSITLLKQKTSRIDQDIQQKRIRINDLSRKEESILEQFDDLERSLNLLERKATSLKSQIGILQKKIKHSNAIISRLTQQIQRSQHYAVKRLVALYKLNQMGKMHFLLSARSIGQFLSMEKGIEVILDSDDRFQQDLIEKRTALTAEFKLLNQDRIEKTSLETEFQVQIHSVSFEKAKKAELLEKIRSEKSLQMAAISGLQQASDHLEQTIKSLKEQAVIPKIPDQTHSFPFLSMKGLLDMPVRGKIVSGFGHYKDARLNVITSRNGIEILADEGSPIRTVLGGTIIYADWFRGYGNLMIIDHGTGFYTVYAHAHELFKGSGERVDTGEVIATVGDTGSLMGPKLYFEIRNHEKPLDPLQWLKPN